MNIHINDATQGVKFKDIEVGTVFTDDYDDIKGRIISQIQMKMTPIASTMGVIFNAIYLDDGSQSHNDDEDIVYPINAKLEVQGE